jgi:hypothetical protein
LATENHQNHFFFEFLVLLFGEEFTCKKNHEWELISSLGKTHTSRLMLNTYAPMMGGSYEWH